MTKNINKKVFAKVKSTDGSYSSNLSFLILNKITSELPQYYFSPSELNIPDNIKLADPHFYKPERRHPLEAVGARGRDARAARHTRHPLAAI